MDRLKSPLRYLSLAVLLLLAVAACFPVVQASQWQAGVATLVALLLFGGAGRAALRLLGAPDYGPLTAVFIGQFVAWLAVYVMSPALAVLTPSGLPLRWWLPVLLLTLGALAKGSSDDRRDMLGGWSSRLVLLSGVTVLLAVVVAFAEQLAHVGHDSKQHIYWTNHLLTMGYVPLNAWHTTVIENYPRGFHVLAAVWTAAAAFPFHFLDLHGVFVKAMPFVQFFLPCLCAIELLARLRRPHGEAGDIGRLLFAGGAVTLLAMYAFLATRAVILNDMSGTAKYSFSGFLALPALLAALAHGKRRLIAAAIAATALLPLCGLLFNPVWLVQAVACVWPALLVAACFYRRREDRRLVVQALPAGLAAAVILTPFLCRDPMVLSQIAVRSPAAATLIMELTQLQTYPAAVAAGVIDPTPKSSRTGSLPCSQAEARWSCWLQLLQRGLTDPYSRVEMQPLRPFRTTMFTPAGRQVFVALGGLMLLGIAAACRARRLDRRDLRPLGAVVAALAVGGLLNAIVASWLIDIGRRANFEWWLLGEYNHWAAHHLSLLGLAALMIVLVHLLTRALPSTTVTLAMPSTTQRSRWLAAAALIAFGIVLTWPFHAGPSRANIGAVTRTPFRSVDLEAFRQVERQIAPGDLVVLPLRTMNAYSETWILDLDEAGTPFLFSDRQTLFHVYLGRSFLLTWRDAESRFCNPDASVRREFLRRQGATKFFVRAQNSETAAFYADFQVCGLPLSAFGVRFPPLISRRGQTLFTLDPEAIEP